jgi:hypothetical protein
MAEYRYELFADYHQVYLQDEQADGDLSESWTQRAVDILLALAPGVIGIGTVRNMTVPVTVQVTDKQPHDDLEDWDQVNECSLNVSSGQIVVAGCTDYFPEAARISVTPGWYRTRIFYGGLHTLNDDGLEGADHYRIVLWPETETEPRVLKQRAQPEGTITSSTVDAVW